MPNVSRFAPSETFLVSSHAEILTGKSCRHDLSAAREGVQLTYVTFDAGVRKTCRQDPAAMLILVREQQRLETRCVKAELETPYARVQPDNRHAPLP
jgi:hypothetical protein